MGKEDKDRNKFLYNLCEKHISKLEKINDNLKNSKGDWDYQKDNVKFEMVIKSIDKASNYLFNLKQIARQRYQTKF